MGDRNLGDESREGPAERARSVPLNNNHVGQFSKLAVKRRGDSAHVAVRILFARAEQPLKRKAA